jgi:uncharacterized protein (UPF0332 family)
MRDPREGPARRPYRLGPEGKFRWETYVDLSEKIVNEDDESYWRCAISRAYYGAFCVARGFVRELQEADDEGIHNTVITYYKGSTSKPQPNKDKRDIGADLFDLRYLRSKSDYWADHKITKEVAEQCVGTARNCLGKMFNFYGDTNYLQYSW